ncbi:hypothetical protein CERSUDRAFT_71183 [Gelatoporia subvermispora B]|uniref:Uncharacterized protein n=1 Tax=Ceriporiopsis subvermispora (strain B) TaxID=914234 RepID=M2PVZ7_CERS8|nr:hypothetical protein CERSUDRAFT_71183 [Gelatoporia subvermispora B]
MFCNLTVEEFSAYSDSAASDEYRENPRLSLLARDRRNLVLDSACPELAPHIVVTPPEGDPWADYWASWSNRVDPQDDSLLTVPVRDHSFGFLPPTLDYDLAIEEIPEGSTPDPMLCPHHLHSEPRRVFSHSRFTQKIHLETQERQAIWLTRILDALRRRQYRTTIILASLEAPSFRCRWGDPDFRVAVERPFKWSDPAEPLLSEYGRYLGSTVIDSHKPCSIPHIVIQEPPPQIPWTLDTGCTPSPQDFGFGYYLTVPSPAVEYINCEAMPDEERYTEDSAGERTPSSSSDMTEVSSLETLVLDEDYGAPSCAVASDPFALDSDDDITPLPSLGPDAKGLLCEKFRSLCLGTFEASWANEDDDLPPFDTWYQGTASRAH